MTIQTIPTLRKATIEDIDALVLLRLDFLRETRKVEDQSIFSAVEEECHRYFLAKITDKSYHSWIAEAEGEIVACGGFIFIEKPPSPRHLSGKEALILNMYTPPRLAQTRPRHAHPARHARLYQNDQRAPHLALRHPGRPARL